ncbi:hypothetical protein HDZ31DRAFT_10489, partial [Schizophyllum fasciatum]
IDNGPTKSVLGGFKGILTDAAEYLQRKVEGVCRTINMRTTVEDLRYSTQMFLTAYEELQSNIGKILNIRLYGVAFPDADKKWIAQFLYSFARYFDTLPCQSIQPT